MAVECCPILVMPSPLFFTERKEQPHILFFICFPVVPARYQWKFLENDMELYENGMPKVLKLHVF
jgi:hypothetical protein